MLVEMTVIYIHFTYFYSYMLGSLAKKRMILGTLAVQQMSLTHPSTGG